MCMYRYIYIYKHIKYKDINISKYMHIYKAGSARR